MGKIVQGVIEGVIITDLAIIEDERGGVLHMLKRSSPVFSQFGEIYFSKIYPGVVKGWKLHKKMISNLAVLVGKVRFVLYDDRPNSITKGKVQEVILSPGGNYKLLTIPPHVWFSWATVDGKTAVVANCASMEHDPQEAETKPWSSIDMPRVWSR